MRKWIISIVLVVLLVIGGALAWFSVSPVPVFETSESSPSFSEVEEGFEQMPEETAVGFDGRYTLAELRDWERPEGPRRVGLQVGHLQNDEVPEEMAELARNGAGATWGPYNERDTVEVIAEQTADILRADGIEVDVLPATVPSGYYADVFVSIHADGNDNERVRGYKTAHFSHDFSGRSRFLEDIVASTYASTTSLPEDESITYYMTGYYAFNWWRYEHALHPMTPAMILETGFITNAADREIIVEEPETAARGIARGITDFLESDAASRRTARSVTFPDLPLAGTYACLEGEWDANDPPAEHGAPCRPGLIADGDRYGLVASGTVDTSTIENYASGTPITVNGTYTPMVGIRDLSWYDYQVRGVVDVTSFE